MEFGLEAAQLARLSCVAEMSEASLIIYARSHSLHHASLCIGWLVGSFVGSFVALRFL